MSAKKCSYSSKYKTLVLAKSSQLEEGAFRDWVKTYFDNPELALSQLRSSDKFLSDHEIVNRRLNESPKKIDSIKSLFSNNSSAYEACIKSFTDSVVENSIYNINTQTWIDAEAVSDGITALNRNLFNYKVELVNKLRDAVGLSFINLDIKSDNVDTLLTNYIYETLNNFDKYTGNVDSSIYSSYVILKNFNRLIEEKTPFIEIRPQYKNSTAHGVNMYIYKGPSVKHRVSWTTNEHVSAKDQYSDLAKILLNYLPEANEYGSIPNSSIGTDGFTSVMNRFKTALIYGDSLAMHRTKLFEGTFDILEALKDYLNQIESRKKIVNVSRDEYLTTQIHKLRGIINNIFGSGLSEDVKEMFTGMFYKTVPLGYLTYANNNSDNRFEKINLNDSWVNTQMLFLQDTVNGAVHGFMLNPKSWETFKKTWGVKVESKLHRIYIKDFGYLDYEEKSGNFKEFDVKDVGFNPSSESALKNFITDLLGIYLPIDSYTEISRMINKDGSLKSDFKEIIAMTILAAEPNSGFTPVNYNKKVLNFRQLFLFNKFRSAANTFSIIFGTDIRNVVNNINGDKLPTNGLTSLIHNTPILASYLAADDIDDLHESLFRDSFLAPRKELDVYSRPGWATPMVRQGVRVGNKTKQVSQLTLSELLEIQMTYDFLDPLLSGDSQIYLQNAQFADKERHWVIPFILKEVSIEGESYDMRDLIHRVALGTISSDKLIEVWQKLRNSRYSALERNLLIDYSEVFDRNFKSLKDVDNYLATLNLSLDELNARFNMNTAELRRIWKKNDPTLTDDDIKDRINSLFGHRTRKVTFVKETTATDIGGIARVNETVLHYIDTFKSLDTAKLRLNKSRALFAKDLFKSRLRLSKHLNSVIKDRWSSIPDSWKEKRGGIETGNVILFKVYDSKNTELNINSGNQHLITDSKNTVKLNPLLEAYLLSDIIYSNEFNFLNTGDVFGHPSKISNEDRSDIEDNGFGSSRYYDSSEASRLVAMNKRAVIYGGAIHSFNHNLANNRGVNKIINIAVIKDPKAPVWNLIGGMKPSSVDDSQDVFDGCGFQSIYEAIFEQQSLKDAAVGTNEKTILGWNHKYYGTQMLIKWAVYALTNEKRRLSINSPIQAERLFRKMHNVVFNKNLDMSELWRDYVGNDTYIKDFNSRRHYKILGVKKLTIGDQVVYARVAVESDYDGNVYPDAKQVYLTNRNVIVDTIDESNLNDFKYNTIYDLDQFFGGAFEESIVNNTLRYTEKGNQIVADIICDYDLKNNFISYLVNESAFKSGAANINQDITYYNETPFDTMEMSTEFGGLQMDAEHELDESEVTEMTQMISALIEKGWSFELVNRIYKDIGSVVLESLKKIKQSIDINGVDPEKLKLIFGKALIEAYSKGDRDTIGLAQSFLARAERALRDESGIKFKFPFSGATINGSFIATVSSLLTKKGIRRKYSGVAAVLNPTQDMIQVYGSDSTTYMMESYMDYIAEWKRNPANSDYSNVSIHDLLNELYVTNIHGDTVLNPFCEEITNDKTKFTFEDTIVIEAVRRDPSTGEILETRLRPIVIDGYEKYDRYKQSYNGRMWIWRNRPRNLKCSDTKFRIGTRTYSVYDTTVVRAGNKSIKKTWTVEDSKIVFDVLKHGINIYGNDVLSYLSENFADIAGNPLFELNTLIEAQDRNSLSKYIDIRRTLYNIIQKQMDNLNEGKLNDVYITNGQTVDVRDVNVSAAEVVMGKMFAKQFQLVAGDDIGKILRDSDFFYNRMSGNYELPNIDRNLFDAVIYTKSGEKILVKLDHNLEYNFDKASNPNITKVDRVVYFNDEELTSDQGKEFYQINADNELYNVVVVNDQERFSELLNSQQIVQYKINYSNNSALELVNDIYDNVVVNYNGTDITINSDSYSELDPESKLRVMQLAEEKVFTSRLRNQANLMRTSFELSLNFIGTRIPAQAMQSFQPMKIVGFTDENVNNVYVNRHNFYLEGSDLDIDKTYMLGYEVNDSGIIETGTKLANRFGINKALQISIAKGRTFKEGESTLKVDKNTINKILFGNIELLNSILDNGNTTIEFIYPKRIEGNNTDEDNTIINEERLQEFNKLKNKFLNLLNLHESSYVSESALKNKVMYQIWQVSLNPRNQLNLHTPVNMDSQKEAAKKSELSKDESNINIDLPSAKPMMQEQNMVGKQCIGITAVAIKCFFAKSAYINNILNAIPTASEEEIINILDSLTYLNPITDKLTILANVNFADIIPKIKSEYISVKNIPAKFKMFAVGNLFNLKNCLKYLERVSNRVDAAMELSGLLSASTDNAKELILSKINATSKLIDIYTIGLQSGCTFDEISDVMTSPIFNAVIRLAQNNILKPFQRSYKLETAINFYLNKALLPGVSEYWLLDYVKKAHNMDLKLETLLPNLQNNVFIEKILNIVYKELSSFSVDSNIDEFYEGAKKSKESILAIADFLEECIDRNYTLSELSRRKYSKGQKNFTDQIRDLEKIRDKFIPAAEEQQILGNMLKINQGLLTSAYEQYTLIERIQNFVTTRIGEAFDLMEFIHNSEYRSKMIGKYESHKSTINILSVISSVPHFSEMFNVLYDNDFILKHLSSKYELSMELARKVNPGYTINENEFRQVGKYINDMFLMSYLTNLDKQFTIHDGVVWYNHSTKGNPSVGEQTIKLNEGLYALASFKSYMENYIIPMLKHHEDYKDEPFIRSLSRSVIYDPKTENRSYYKLPLNMMTIDESTETKEIYESLLSSFNRIASNTLEDGWTIADLFFVYNSIVYKDDFGQNSMTRLFEDLVDTENSSLVSGFYEYLSDIDDSSKIRDEFRKSLSIEDVKFYISNNVRGSYVRSNVSWTGDENFTFLMPSLINNFVANKPNVKPLIEDQNRYSYKFDSRDLLNSMISWLKSKYGDGNVMVHSTTWFKNNGLEPLASIPAVISDGIVWINSDIASFATVLHEYTHLVLSTMKFSKDKAKQDLYYKLVSIVRTNPDYEKIAERYRNLGFIGSDLDEEVFANIMEDYFNNRLNPYWNYSMFESNKGNFIEALNDLLGTSISKSADLFDIMASSPSAVIKTFGSKIIDPDSDFEVDQLAVKWRLTTQRLKEKLTDPNYEGSDKVIANCD